MEVDYIEFGGFEEETESFVSYGSDQVESIVVRTVVGSMIHRNKVELTITLNEGALLGKQILMEMLDEDEEDD
jgi:hypothetical protein